jgi:hypothetical protein
MQKYKKRVRMLIERFGLSIDYAHDGGLIISNLEERLIFTPLSKSEMNCAVRTAAKEFKFDCLKDFVFDIIMRFAIGRSLEGYNPKGLPLTLQEYIDEEGASNWITELKNCILSGTAKNDELGGNHYNAEYYNGVLILFDIFTGAPANVVEFN